jgi:hypothetical protein
MRAGSVDPAANDGGRLRHIIGIVHVQHTTAQQHPRAIARCGFDGEPTAGSDRIGLRFGQADLFLDFNRFQTKQFKPFLGNLVGNQNALGHHANLDLIAILGKQRRRQRQHIIMKSDYDLASP